MHMSKYQDILALFTTAQKQNGLPSGYRRENVCIKITKLAKHEESYKVLFNSVYRYS